MDARLLFGKATKFRYRTTDFKSDSGVPTSFYYARYQVVFTDVPPSKQANVSLGIGT
jgi:hypothetical protein